MEIRWLLRVFISVLIISVSCATKEQVDEFKKLFTGKRVEQIQAVQQLLSIDHEKQQKLIHQMLDKIMVVLLKSRTHMESSGWVWGQDEDFPQQDSTRNALALLMENTCFMSDILLRFPDLMHLKFKENNEWAALYKWSLTFVVESQLTDESTNKLLHLASQEMGVIEKDPDFHNPYKQPKIKQKRFEDPPAPKKKEKKKIKRGPRLSKTEL